MRLADALIEEIISASQIPSAKRRRELTRELRSHIEDFVLIARGAGHADDQIESMVLTRFGDPRQMGSNFAWVYRRERAALRLLVFGLCTLAVASVISAATLAMQAGAAIGFGIPVLRVLGTRHTVIEAVDILATVAVYAGLLSLEKLFEQRGFQKALGWLSVIFAVLIGVAAVAGIRAPYLIFGFANAIFLRTVQELLKSWTARFGTVVACFGLFAVILPWTGSPAGLASWLLMGVGYQVMTGLAARVDRELFVKLQQL